ncbi:MAG: fasciclin domain-containing protein [Bacteroidaceae bacterium]|nr:fasciclin domain-containing protein [Bacteroidaceae bacterium]
MKTLARNLFLFLLVFTSCTEHIDQTNRYTFTEETISSYLEKHEQYSQYVAVLSDVRISKRSQSTLYQLLSARGNYTVFAPTNEAIQLYLDTLYLKGVTTSPSWDGFKNTEQLDSIKRVIALNSIVDGGDNTPAYQSSAFPAQGEELILPNMNDRKLTFTYGTNPDSIYVNTTSLISLTNRDITAINGVIHAVNTVVAPSNATLADALAGYLDSGEEGFLVMSMLVRACGLLDTLSRVKDEVYEELYLTDQIADLPVHPTEHTPGYLPKHRKYGFTLFAETDAFWRQALGKEPQAITIDDVRQYIQQEGLCPDAVDDDNYASVNNALNQFVTYHLLPMRIPKNKLTIHYNERGYVFGISTSYSIPVWETYTTMGKRRLLRIYESVETNGDVYLNRFPRLDNGRHGTYHETGCDPDKEGIRLDMPEDMNPLSFVNAVIYPINRVLAYDNDTRDNFGRNRQRYDAAALMPELMNNDIRIDRIGTDQTMRVGIPDTRTYRYFDDLTIEDNTFFYYLSGYKKAWANYQGDELNVIGSYELTFRLPPVPRRTTYEIRYQVSAGSPYRGMCQVYFGNDPDNLSAMGIPLDLRMGGIYHNTTVGKTPSIVGWEADVQDDDDYNADVDKKMRNNGFMKGPAYFSPESAPGRTCRDLSDKIRRIIVTATMDPDQTYYLRFKSVLEEVNLQFYMDFIEVCPKEVYNNPITPEDVW